MQKESFPPSVPALLRFVCFIFPISIFYSSGLNFGHLPDRHFTRPGLCKLSHRDRSFFVLLTFGHLPDRHCTRPGLCKLSLRDRAYFASLSFSHLTDRHCTKPDSANCRFATGPFQCRSFYLPTRFRIPFMDPVTRFVILIPGIPCRSGFAFPDGGTTGIRSESA